MDELHDLRVQEERLHRFQIFKSELLAKLQHTYVEFVTFLLKLLDTQSHNQQKFHYWTNLSHFHCDPEIIEAEAGDDLPDHFVSLLDTLFRELKQVVLSVSKDDTQTIRHQIGQSRVYQSFMRHNRDPAISQMLLKGELTHGDLRVLQRLLKQTSDPKAKEFYDQWLVPNLKTKPKNKTWSSLQQACIQLVKGTFERLQSVTTRGELERIGWLLTRQWNFLFVELDTALQSQIVAATTSLDAHQDNKGDNGKNQKDAKRQDHDTVRVVR